MITKIVFLEKKKKKEKKERDTSYGNIKKSYYQDKDPIPIKKEFNLFDHPEMKPESSLDNDDEKISYLDKCKILVSLFLLKLIT